MKRRMPTSQLTHVVRRRRSSATVEHMKRLHAKVRVSTYEFILEYAGDLSLGAALDRMVEELRWRKGTTTARFVESRLQ